MADLKGLSPGDHAFITVGITLDEGPRNSAFDLAGSAIIVHERPDSYGAKELVGLGAGVGNVDLPGRARGLEALRPHPLQQ